MIAFLIVFWLGLFGLLWKLYYRLLRRGIAHFDRVAEDRAALQAEAIARALREPGAPNHAKRRVLASREAEIAAREEVAEAARTTAETSRRAQQLTDDLIAARAGGARTTGPTSGLQHKREPPADVVGL